MYGPEVFLQVAAVTESTSVFDYFFFTGSLCVWVGTIAHRIGIANIHDMWENPSSATFFQCEAMWTQQVPIYTNDQQLPY
jgi:hypothetical protein